MKRCGAILIFIILAGCKKPYIPPVINAPGSYLVVEGIVNPGTDSTIIKLSRTVKINAANTQNPEAGATITVESDANTSWPLTETAAGHYFTTDLNLDTAHKYRMRIKTADNKEYLSDFVPAKITPPIDSVGFHLIASADSGIQIYANTRDPKNNTRYYRWDYDEAWAFHAKYVSYFISNYIVIKPRTQEQYITYCYQQNVSSDIVLGSTAKLSQDVVYHGPIVKIPSTSEKIEIKYSILLRQYALTADAYTFWQNLRKNTEQLGSVFDALPTQINGNIHCISNPSQQVVGYVSVSTVQSKRIYISRQQLPENWLPLYPYSCFMNDGDTVHIGSANYRNTILLNPGTFITTYPWMNNFNNPIAYYHSTRECADCTIRGSLTPPLFWK